MRDVEELEAAVVLRHVIVGGLVFRH
jgi:hypothetical protein